MLYFVSYFCDLYVYLYNLSPTINPKINSLEYIFDLCCKLIGIQLFLISSNFYNYFADLVVVVYVTKLESIIDCFSNKQRYYPSTVQLVGDICSQVYRDIIHPQFSQLEISVLRYTEILSIHSSASWRYLFSGIQRYYPSTVQLVGDICSQVFRDIIHPQFSQLEISVLRYSVNRVNHKG